MVLSLVITRILTVGSGGKTNIRQNFDRIHNRLYALGLIILWLRFMRSCRVFKTLGPFIAILGNVLYRISFRQLRNLRYAGNLKYKYIAKIRQPVKPDNS